MSKTQIWHNPRCSKSRQTLALLQENGITPEIIEYLKNPPSVGEIADTAAALGTGVDGMVRKGEAIYKTLGLSRSTSEEVLIQAMAKNPILIERPIVFHGGKAAIGRPPEGVLKLFQN